VAVGLIGTLAGSALGGRVPLTPAAPGAGVAAQDSGITVEFLGWSHYRLTSATGTVVITNPFITNNPDAAITVDEAIAHGADVILVADGHADELGDAVAIAKATGAQLLIPFEAGDWLTRRDNIPRAQVPWIVPGDTQRVKGITINALNAVHGSGMNAGPEAPYAYGGPAFSFMVTFENGFTIYFSGSSAATMDMAMWGEWYKPDAAILNISAFHNPRDAAMVGKLLTTNNPNLKTVFPHHHRVRPQGGGLFTPSDLQTELQRLDVTATFIVPNLLQEYHLTK
jgi:L-ascorbate metabolism protein UlaG (beta-lactamase superfamily)